MNILACLFKELKPIYHYISYLIIYNIFIRYHFHHCALSQKQVGIHYCQSWSPGLIVCSDSLHVYDLSCLFDFESCSPTWMTNDWCCYLPQACCSHTDECLNFVYFLRFWLIYKAFVAPHLLEELIARLLGLSNLSGPFSFVFYNTSNVDSIFCLSWWFGRQRPVQL